MSGIGTEGSFHARETATRAPGEVPASIEPTPADVYDVYTHPEELGTGPLGRVTAIPRTWEGVPRSIEPMPTVLYMQMGELWIDPRLV